MTASVMIGSVDRDRVRKEELKMKRKIRRAAEEPRRINP